MLIINCKGTPYEIGLTHGRTASLEISRSIAFYGKLFLRYSHQTWPQVLSTARQFDANVAAKWPRYHEEMRGVADGASVSLLDVLALNVRTEIAFGLFADGCTSLSWHGEAGGGALLGQNWDWMEEQKRNLVVLCVEQGDAGLPDVKMVTEAGIIGKIGLNSKGVGVCFNAIRARGLDVTRMPAHLGLRRALDSHSAMEAVEALEREGMASSAHALIADAKESVGLEFTYKTFARLEKDAGGRVYHSNHLLGEHPGVVEPPWLPHSEFRVHRIEELACHVTAKPREGEVPSLESFARLFDDHEGRDGPICRMEEGENGVGTLFNIVMDLSAPRAVVRLGRPCMAEDIVKLDFQGD